VSWQASVLVGLIWLFSALFRKISPVFHYWLWVIVLVRLMVPIAEINLPVKFGVSGHFRDRMETIISELAADLRITDALSYASSRMEGFMADRAPYPAATQVIEYTIDDNGEPVMTTAAYEEINISPIGVGRTDYHPYWLITVIWMSVVVVFLIATIGWYWRAYNLVKRFPVVTRPVILEYVAAKCWVMGIGEEVEL
jgi:hypothetical protein